MRWAAMAIMAVVLITGCRKQEKDVEALSREAVEDEVTAVLDSLERVSAASRQDTAPIVQVPPPAVHMPAPDTTALSVVEPAGKVSDTALPAGQSDILPVGTPVVETTESPQQGKAGWVVQIGIFSEYTAALEMADKYKQQSFPAFVRRVDRDGQTFYRLRVGVYDTYEQAQAAGKQLKDQYSLDYWIARNQ